MYKKDYYLTPAKSEKRLFNLSDPNSFKELWEYEKEIEQDNEAFISQIEQDLERYDEMIVEDVKTKSDAYKVKDLVNSRLRILEKYRDNSPRYEEAIKEANYFLNKLDNKLNYLPDTLYVNPSSLAFNYDEAFIDAFLNFVKEIGFFENPNDDMIKYAFFNSPLNTQFVPIKIKKGKGDALIYLIYKFANKIDDEGYVIDHKLGDIRSKAYILFGMKNGEKRMPTQKRYPNDGCDIDDFFKNAPA